MEITYRGFRKSFAIPISQDELHFSFTHPRGTIGESRNTQSFSALRQAAPIKV